MQEFYRDPFKWLLFPIHLPSEKTNEPVHYYKALILYIAIAPTPLHLILFFCLS